MPALAFETGFMAPTVAGTLAGPQPTPFGLCGDRMERAEGLSSPVCPVSKC